MMELMPIVEIIRLENSMTFGALGVLRINKEIFGFTLEPPKRDNTVNESCIPTGQYLAHAHRSIRFGDTYRVAQVPGRSEILFHAGNVMDDTSGCILLGSEVGKLKTARRAVLNSGQTFSKFMKELSNYDKFHFTVMEKF